jgi:hypothetical protein
MTIVLRFSKYAILALVIFAILYVLISPMPEMDATCAGRMSAAWLFVLTTALVNAFVLMFIFYLDSSPQVFLQPENVIAKNCSRLC